MLTWTDATRNSEFPHELAKRVYWERYTINKSVMLHSGPSSNNAAFFGYSSFEDASDIDRDVGVEAVAQTALPAGEVESGEKSRFAVASRYIPVSVAWR